MTTKWRVYREASGWTAASPDGKYRYTNRNWTVVLRTATVMARKAQQRRDYHRYLLDSIHRQQREETDRMKCADSALLAGVTSLNRMMRGL